MTDPPLIHFTTADLGNMADGRYGRFDIIRSLIDEAGALVLVTEDHLLEFLPLRRESIEKRLQLASALPMILVRWRPADIWVSGRRAWNVERCTPDVLRGAMADGQGNRAYLELRRELDRRSAEADFFSRTAQLACPGQTGAEVFSPRRIDKFQHLNDRHGSDLRPAWERMRRASHLLEKLAPSITRVIPRPARRQVAKVAHRLGQRRRDFEPRCEARRLGVHPDNLAFQVWWETRQKLWAKPDETGGLAEVVDLRELQLWPVCELQTLDKRMYNAVSEALRTLGLANDDAILRRFVKAGEEKRVIGGLVKLVARQKARSEGRGCKQSPG